MADGQMRGDEVELTVNGEPRRLPAGLMVADLLDRLGVPGDMVAVERNRTIVPRSALASTALAEGDAIEIVQFVGGG